MSNSDTQNQLMPITVLVVITVLNVGILTFFLTAYIGVSSLILSNNQIYVLAGLELVCVLVAYMVGRRRK